MTLAILRVLSATGCAGRARLARQRRRANEWIQVDLLVAMMDCRKRCGCRNKISEQNFGRRGEGKMKRELDDERVLAVALLASTGAARAQETQQAPPQDRVVIKKAACGGAQEGPGPVMIQGGVGVEGDSFFADHIELPRACGLHGGRVVKGAPFSAVSVSETTQVLADGIASCGDANESVPGQ